MDRMSVDYTRGERARNIAILVMLPDVVLYWSSLRPTSHVCWARDDHCAAMMLYLACE